MPEPLIAVMHAAHRHQCFLIDMQAALATGLLGLTNWKPRFVGFLGVVASAINCYMLFPALPKPAEQSARKEVQLESLKPATLKMA